jgi:hypothetical protein
MEPTSVQQHGCEEKRTHPHHRTVSRRKETRQYGRQSAMSAPRSIQYNAPAPVRPRPGTKYTVALSGIGTSPAHKAIPALLLRHSRRSASTSGSPSLGPSVVLRTARVPARFPGSIFVSVHVPEHATSSLPRILACGLAAIKRAGGLAVAQDPKARSRKYTHGADGGSFPQRDAAGATSDDDKEASCRSMQRGSRRDRRRAAAEAAWTSTPSWW